MFGLNNWHGHNSCLVSNADHVLFTAKHSPNELEKWFIPTLSMLRGININENDLGCDNLFAIRHKMPNGSEFESVDSFGEIIPWYLSSTDWHECEQNNEFPNVGTVNFINGSSSFAHKNDPFIEGPVRPVRAELRLC